MVCLNSWLDSLLYLFFWICNKWSGLLSPYFPLDLVYCYKKFVSQNWPRKFVNQSQMPDQRNGRLEILAVTPMNTPTASACQQHARPAWPAALH